MTPTALAGAGSWFILAIALFACSGSSADHASSSAAAASTSGAGGARTTSSTSSHASSSSGGGAVPDAGADAGDGGRDFSTDTSLFYGASRCADAGVQLCEDFETGVLDTSIWTVNGTTPVIDGVHAARGKKALHITKTGNGLSSIKETVTFPEANDTYFGRVFVYFNQLPTAPGMTYAHWTFVAASGTGTTGEIRLSGQLSKGQNLFGVGTDSGMSDGGTGDWTTSDNDPAGDPSPVPTGAWACIEWMHKGDTNETRFYWNAVEHPSLYTTETQHGGNANPYILPDFTNVWIGWQEYQTSTEPFEMWVDEIAIDKARIGCVL